MLGDGARTQIGCASTSDEDKDAICEGAEWIGALVVDWLQFKMHALVAGLVHMAHLKYTVAICDFLAIGALNLNCKLDSQTPIERVLFSYHHARTRRA